MGITPRLHVNPPTTKVRCSGLPKIHEFQSANHLSIYPVTTIPWNQNTIVSDDVMIPSAMVPRYHGAPQYHGAKRHGGTIGPGATIPRYHSTIVSDDTVVPSALVPRYVPQYHCIKRCNGTIGPGTTIPWCHNTIVQNDTGVPSALLPRYHGTKRYSGRYGQSVERPDDRTVPCNGITWK